MLLQEKPHLCEEELKEESKEKLQEEYFCELCLELLTAAVECGECNQLYCKACIDEWLKY